MDKEAIIILLYCKGCSDMESKPVVIDTDISMGIPGRDVDDGLAVIFALNSPEIDIKGITKVYGNAPLDKVNVCLDDLIDVYKSSYNKTLGFGLSAGADVPLRKMDENYSNYFLCDCFENEKKSDYFYQLSLTQKIKKGDLYPAVKFLADMVKEYPNDIIIAPIGPLTNIALFLKIFPDLADDIAMFSIMGGKLNGYEFNFVNDPIATNVVLKSSVPTQIAGLEVCQAQQITQEHLNEISQYNTEVSNYIVENTQSWLKLNKLYHLYKKDSGFYPFDLCAFINLVDPDIVTYESKYVRQTIPTVNWSKFNLFCRSLEVDPTTEKRNNFHKCYNSSDTAVQWGIDIDSEKFLETVISRLK